MPVTGLLLSVLYLYRCCGGSPASGTGPGLSSGFAYASWARIRSIPTYMFGIRSPYYPMHRYPRVGPFSGGLLGSALLMCGLVAIGNMFAPQAVEQLLPNWKAKFGVLIPLGVALGFARSVWRLIIPIFALTFWIVALFAVIQPNIPKNVPSIQAAFGDSSPQAITQHIAPSNPVMRPKAPALPDEAYFPPQKSKSSNGKLPLPDFIQKMMR
jgi:hypothetical protein